MGTRDSLRKSGQARADGETGKDPDRKEEHGALGHRRGSLLPPHSSPQSSCSQGLLAALRGKDVGPGSSSVSGLGRGRHTSHHSLVGWHAPVAALSKLLHLGFQLPRTKHKGPHTLPALCHHLHTACPGTPQRRDTLGMFLRHLQGHSLVGSS